MGWIMVKFTFKELEEFVAEISLIIMAISLIILVSLCPNESTLGLFNDVIFLIVGAIIGMIGGKQSVKDKIGKEDSE
jgi:hypothetical protein